METEPNTLHGFFLDEFFLSVMDLRVTTVSVLECNYQQTSAEKQFLAGCIAENSLMVGDTLAPK